MRIILLMLVFMSAAVCWADEETGIKNVNAEEAKALLADASKKIMVLDVRTPAEYKEGHIKGAKLIDLNGSEFETKLEALDKSSSYLLHCRSGGRSSVALAKLKKLGFKSVYHLDGGILAWQDAGGAVEK